MPSDSDAKDITTTVNARTAAENKSAKPTAAPELLPEKLLSIIEELTAIPNEVERAKRLERLAGIHKIPKRALLPPSF